MQWEQVRSDSFENGFRPREERRRAKKGPRKRRRPRGEGLFAFRERLEVVENRKPASADSCRRKTHRERTFRGKARPPCRFLSESSRDDDAQMQASPPSDFRRGRGFLPTTRLLS